MVDKLQNRDMTFAVLTAWQRGEMEGAEARLRTCSVSYGALYGLARDLGVEIRFTPRDIAQRIVSGALTPAEAQRMLGIEDSEEMAAFVEAWTL
jgi:hypothetical protein